MREIRQSGSVGGETLTRLPYLNREIRPPSPHGREVHQLSVDLQIQTP